NVLNKNHTHVGLGIALIAGQFRYYEEYIDRYFVSLDAPDQIKVGEDAVITVMPPPKSWFYAVIGYFESFPSPMTIQQLNSQSSYTDFTDSQAFAFWPDQFT